MFFFTQCNVIYLDGSVGSPRFDCQLLVGEPVSADHVQEALGQAGVRVEFDVGGEDKEGSRAETAHISRHICGEEEVVFYNIINIFKNKIFSPLICFMVKVRDVLRSHLLITWRINIFLIA